MSQAPLATTRPYIKGMMDYHGAVEMFGELRLTMDEQGIDHCILGRCRSKDDDSSVQVSNIGSTVLSDARVNAVLKFMNDAFKMEKSPCQCVILVAVNDGMVLPRPIPGCDGSFPDCYVLNLLDEQMALLGISGAVGMNTCRLEVDGTGESTGEKSEGSV